MSKKHEQEPSTPLKEESPIAPVAPAAPAAPMITWERASRKPSQDPNSNVIPFDTIRRNNTSETEATFTVREFTSTQGEEPVRLIVISSGFGQKLPVHHHTVHNKAAA